jgi:hypothetical protein
MYLILILPDGSKSLIPAEWTDYALPLAVAPSVSSAHISATLGSLEDLLHTRAIVDALFSRLAAGDSADSKSLATKESTIAGKKFKGKKSESLRPASQRNLPLGNVARRTQDARD